MTFSILFRNLRSTVIKIRHSSFSSSSSGGGGNHFIKFRAISSNNNYNFSLNQQENQKSILNQHKYLYKSEENNNADAYLRTADGYKNTFFINPSSGVDYQPIVLDFIAAASQENVESVISPTYKNIVDKVLSNLKSLNDNELLQILYHLRYFAPCQKVDDPEFVKIWSSLDAECVARMSSNNNWSLDFLFQVADLWTGLKLVRFSKFHKNLMSDCLKNCGRLKKEHFVRLLYSLNIARSLPTPSVKYDIEDYLRNNTTPLNHHEISVVTMACFKTETVISDPTVFEALLDSVLSSKELMDPISVASVAKFTRFCSSPKVRRVLSRVQAGFLSEVDRLGVQACTHLALIGTKVQTPYLPLIDAVVKKMITNIEEARLKDLERISLVMTMFDVDEDNILGNLIVKELRSPSQLRKEEIEEYGRCLPAILHYLSFREIFPQDLMDYVLGKKFLQTYYDNTPDIYLRELVSLDFCAELEVEGYFGARLDKATRDQILKSHVSRLSKFIGPKISAYEMFLRMATNILDSFIGGPDYYLVCNILPQHQCKKIVFCMDKKTGKPAVIPNSYRNLPEHEIKYLPSSSENLSYHVIFICNRNDYFVSPTKRLTGSAIMMVRQLTKMGYNVHVEFPPFTHYNANFIFQKLRQV